MNTYAVTAERIIDAPPERVYNVVIDMEEHRKILPKQFESLEVVIGGKGAGTVFRMSLNVMGNRSTLEMSIAEPEPGRVIEERDDRAGITTTWTLTPLEDGRRCLLQLMSEFPRKPGFAGLMERLFTPPVIRSIYKQELHNIQEYLTTGTVAGEK